MNLTTTYLPYNIEKFIDGRTHTKCIGFVQKGLENQVIPAFFHTTLTQELTDLYKRSKSAFIDKPVIVKVNHFLIYEKTHLKGEIATAELNLSFIEKVGNEYFELLEVGLTNKKKGLDVTAKHASNVVEVLDKAFRYFDKRLRENKVFRKKLGNIISKNHEDQKRYACLTSENPGKGIFWTYSDFRDNILDKNTAFRIGKDYSERKIFESVYLYREDKATPITDAWGFSDGKNYFIKFDKDYIRLGRNGSHFLFDGPKLNTHMTHQHQKGLDHAMFLGGALGSMIYLAQIDKYSNETQRYFLDLNSGNYLPEGFSVLDAIKSTVIFHSSEKNNPGNQIEIRINGNRVCELSPKSYYIYTGKLHNEAAEVCVQSNSESICTNFYPQLFDNQLFVIKEKSKKKLALTRPYGKERKDVLLKLEFTPGFSQACEN